ncbi:dihydrofolate reductase family protein [Glutamicibacter endophyticus]|uniref:dihydrofolate reductase family protein n=1 Tax=Glutamicibacter endophyticus TaxID=1522174 RepID=UPI003AF008BC
MKLTLTQFVTLDGVSQGPGSPTEDQSDGFTRGGWFVPFIDDDFLQQASQWLDAADGLLFGRRTYLAFARDWPQIEEPDPFTVRMNTLPKYVVSSTLKTGEWKPTTVLYSNVVAQISALKGKAGDELQIHGSSVLAASLLDAGLIDSIRLAVAPVVLGQGRRLFTGHRDSSFELTSQRVTSTGLTLLEFSYAGAVQTEEYSGVVPRD